MRHEAASPAASTVSTMPVAVVSPPPPLDEPCPPQPSPSADSVVDREAAEGPRGRLPPDVIQKVVRGAYGQFRGCYEAGLASNPKLQGRVSVRFVIDREGRVPSAVHADIGTPPPTEAAQESRGSASPAEPHFPDAEVVQCILHEYRKLVFPKPDGGIVTVVYPVVFTPP